MTESEVQKIQGRYSYLVNYSMPDPEAPIDPLTYVDSNGDHLLHIAASAGDLETVESLLEAGVDPNLVGDMGCTALHYANMNGDANMAALLISRGASRDIVNQFGVLAG